MALTTAARRASAMLDTLGMPLPDGTLSQADRGWQLGVYTGIVTATAGGVISLAHFWMGGVATRITLDAAGAWWHERFVRRKAREE